uniref:Uncharacterized protein n=1 Tax=Clandestinovirus TaxID=2831644 RepID=A0A8F8PMF3_9VIRU|nr:hypothetical protein KOM_12_216 [Clandestinovirus]
MELSLKEKGMKHEHCHGCEKETVKTVNEYLQRIDNVVITNSQLRVRIAVEMMDYLLFRQCPLAILYREPRFRQTVLARLELFTKQPDFGHCFVDSLRMVKRIDKQIKLDEASL